jgi:dTDP-4-dehydrorhamnose reductase
MSKILILGAKGNLGCQLVKAFNEGNEVIGWDKGEIDITDKEQILKKAEELKPDIIINAAAYNAVDKCEESEDEYDLAKRLNIDGPRHIAEAALAVGAIFIQYSSDYVFDGKKKKGYSENDAAAPINRYGKTKAHGERQIIALSGKGLKWYLIRPSKLFGPKGESEAAKPSFFDLMLKLSREKKEFNMVDKEEVSCFTYTPDLAQATRKLADSRAGYGIYHIVNSGPASWYEAAKYLFALKGITDVKLNRVRSSAYPRPAKRPKYSILLNTKLEPLRDWREALDEYLCK